MRRKMATAHNVGPGPCGGRPRADIVLGPRRPSRYGPRHFPPLVTALSSAACTGAPPRRGPRSSPRWGGRPPCSPGLWGRGARVPRGPCGPLFLPPQRSAAQPGSICPTALSRKALPLRPPAPPPPAGGLRGARGWSGGRTSHRKPSETIRRARPGFFHAAHHREPFQAEPLPNEHAGGCLPWRFPLPAAVRFPMFPPVG